MDDTATAVYTAQLAVSMKEVHGMPKGLYQPQQPIFADCSPLLPAIIAVAFTT